MESRFRVWLIQKSVKIHFHFVIPKIGVWLPHKSCCNYVLNIEVIGEINSQVHIRQAGDALRDYTAVL